MGNRRLDKDVKELSSEVDVLTKSSDQLGEQLKAFDDLRTEMEAYAKQNNTTLDALMGNMTGVFDKMRELQMEHEATLLLKCFTDLEFKDDEEGLTFAEWRRFCARVPATYRATLQKDEQKMFDKTDQNHDQRIQISEVKLLIQQLVGEENKATANNPQG